MSRIKIKQHELRVLQDFTGGTGVDVVMEMLANVNLQNDLEILKKHGRIIVSSLNNVYFLFFREHNVTKKNFELESVICTLIFFVRLTPFCDKFLLKWVSAQ